MVERTASKFGDLAADSTTPLGLAWDAAQYALDVDDRFGLRTVRRELERQVGANVNRSGALDAAARIAQLAAFVRHERAVGDYRWFRRLAGSGADDAATARLSLRVGGSAPLAGHLSLALEVALDLHDGFVDLDALDAFLERPEVADTERVHSDLHHAILGADPQYALQQFARFARDASRAISA